MIVECPKCKQNYKVNEKLIPVGGASVRCPSCSNIFTIYQEPLDIPLEPVSEEISSSPLDKLGTQEQEITTEELSEPIEETVVTETPSTHSTGIETTIPPVEERTKLWEKLQESYMSSKKEKDEVETEEIPSIKEEDLQDAFAPETQATESFTETKPIETPSETITEEESLSGESTIEIPTIEETTHKEEVTPSVTELEEAPPTEEEKVEKEAKRLARSLVKDILLYHGDKVEIGLRQGNLAQLIGDEIRKSWKFYKDSFPLEKTGGVNFFKNALNEIIGKGKPIFK
jgi:predicted Zn finger-like uncharacterized protein